MRHITPGALVLVGGHSRGVGKTYVVERWLREHPGWMAIKVSAHRHAGPGVDGPLIEEAAGLDPVTQTGRYLLAGAHRAFLLRAPDRTLPRAAAFIERLRADGTSVIVESNRLVRFLQPELLLFAVDPAIADWKPSSFDCLRAPHLICCLRGRPGHDRHYVTYSVGDGAAPRADSIHRVELSRAAAHTTTGVGEPGPADRGRSPG
jgi:hypothetical protein